MSQRSFTITFRFIQLFSLLIIKMQLKLQFLYDTILLDCIVCNIEYKFTQRNICALIYDCIFFNHCIYPTLLTIVEN